MELGFDNNGDHHGDDFNDNTTITTSIMMTTIMTMMMITWELSILRYQVISAGGREPQDTHPIEYSLM